MLLNEMHADFQNLQKDLEDANRLIAVREDQILELEQQIMTLNQRLSDLTKENQLMKLEQSAQ